MNTTTKITVSGGYQSDEWQQDNPVPIDQQFASRAEWQPEEALPDTLTVEGFTGIVTGGVPFADADLYWDDALRAVYARWTGAFNKAPIGAGDPGASWRVSATVTWGPVDISWLNGDAARKPELMPIEINLEEEARGYDAGWVGSKSAYEGTVIGRSRPLGDRLRTAADRIIKKLRGE